MQKIVLSYFIIIIVLIITGCTSSSGNRGKAGFVLHSSGLAMGSNFPNNVPVSGTSLVQNQRLSNSELLQKASFVLDIPC